MVNREIGDVKFSGDVHGIVNGIVVIGSSCRYDMHAPARAPVTDLDVIGGQMQAITNVRSR